MKTLLTLLSAGFLSLNVLAQENQVSVGIGAEKSKEIEPHKGDTTKLKFSGVKIWIMENDEKNETAVADTTKKKKRKHHDDDDFKRWSGMELGVNGYTTASNSFDLPASQDYLELDYGKSICFNWNVFETDIKIYKHYVQLVTGIGFSWNHYAFKNDITLSPDLPYVGYSSDSLISYTKNKLNFVNVNVPLLIEFNTNNEDADRSFHLAAGILGGYRIGNAKTKQEFEMNNYEYEVKRKDDFNLAPFKYSATVRAGYGDFTLFANYGLSEFFKSGNGNPRVYPVEAGVALNF